MKILRYATSVIFLFAYLSVSSQNKTWLGATFGLANDDFDFESASPGFRELSLVSPTAGITIEQELTAHFSLLGGVLHKNQWGTITHENATFQHGYHVMNLLRIPMGLKGRLNLLRGNVRLFAVAGGNLMLNLNYSPGEKCNFCFLPPGFSSFFSGISESHRTALRRTFFLAEGGGGFDFRILKTARLGISVNHFLGFEKVVDADYDFTDSAGTTHHADAYSKGNHWSTTLHLHYPISRWWR